MCIRDRQEADKLQAKTGIPVVCVAYDGIFDPTMDQSLELIGTLLGKQERCKEVIDFMQAAKQDLNNRTKDIPDDQKPTVFSGAVSFRGGHGIEAVSYTHLDVYKRQPIHCLLLQK